MAIEISIRIHCWRARLSPACRASSSTSSTSPRRRRSTRSQRGSRLDRRPYDKWLAYGQSKTANALFAVALDARGAGDKIRGFSVHPGAVITELGRSMTPDEQRAMIEAAGKLSAGFKSTEQGAATTVWCATSPALDGKGGVYCEDADIARAVPADFPEPRGVRRWAMDADLAEQLWRVSEASTGLAI